MPSRGRARAVGFQWPADATCSFKAAGAAHRALRASPDALVGQVLPGSDGRLYPLRERIGEGGQGWVFRATWSGSIDVVVKVLRPDTANQDSAAEAPSPSVGT